MKKFACPSCGAEGVFASSLSVYAVCKFCSAMVVRQDEALQAIGTMAALPDDLSPFRIGTEGHFGKVHFLLVGRMKLAWDDGSWNEWFMATDDGRRGWLSDAQGAYAVSFEVEPPGLDFALRAVQHQNHPSEHTAFIGSKLALDQRYLRVTDVKRATCIGSEGELPLAAPQGRKTMSVDLTGTRGEFGSVEIETGKLRAFVGRYVEWKDLGCTKVRQFDGW